MRYLYMPGKTEELQVRGRYEFLYPDGTRWATEHWERYRNASSTMQTWRSEWRGDHGGENFNIRAHTLVSSDGVERLKLRQVFASDSARDLTITTLPDQLLLNNQGEIEEIALPVGYGLFTPQPSLARFALPFPLEREGKQLGMVFYLRLLATQFRGRPVKFSYTPLGFREFTILEQRVRARGWQLEVPGVPLQQAWFDRNGNCLLWVDENSTQPWEARLTAWQTFG